jgi:beta-galactosidase GanA
MLTPLPPPVPTAPPAPMAAPWTGRRAPDGILRVLVSAEFHYFRVLHRARLRPLLAALRGAGFNAVRLYFHWGYYSPWEGVPDFTGNRDAPYLLRLCEKLQLFVIPAPGPYICAEVQAGGCPL